MRAVCVLLILAGWAIADPFTLRNVTGPSSVEQGSTHDYRFQFIHPGELVGGDLFAFIALDSQGVFLVSQAIPVPADSTGAFDQTMSMTFLVPVDDRYVVGIDGSIDVLVGGVLEEHRIPSFMQGVFLSPVDVVNVFPLIRVVEAPRELVPVGSAWAYKIIATDPGGAFDPLTYLLDFDNDGKFEQMGASGQHIFSNVGLHTVNIRVEDSFGGFATQQLTVRVVPEPALLGVLGLILVFLWRRRT